MSEQAQATALRSELDPYATYVEYETLLSLLLVGMKEKRVIMQLQLDNSNGTRIPYLWVSAGCQPRFL